MDIIKIAFERITNFLWGLPLNLKTLIIRLGLWSISVWGSLWFGWVKIRNSAVQVFIAFIVTYLFFSIRLSGFVGKIGKWPFALLFGLCLLCMIFLPSRISFLLAPKYGNQLIVKRVLYITIAILSLIQLIVH